MAKEKLYFISCQKKVEKRPLIFMSYFVMVCIYHFFITRTYIRISVGAKLNFILKLIKIGDSKNENLSIKIP